MNFTYSVFGLLLQSNLPIPELIAEKTSASIPSVIVHMDASPYGAGEIRSEQEALTYTSAYTDEAGQPALRIWKIAGSGLLRLAYYDGTQFWMNREGTELWAQWPKNLTIEDAATYLLGPVLGLLLRLRGVTCLHASAVAFAGHAIAFVGSEGAGKSTTAALMARKGCAVISDDVVALVERNGAFYVYPAYPYLCLWPDSVTMVYGPDKQLPSFSASWEKRLLSLAGNNLRFEAQALPLGAIFVLGERSLAPDAPFLERLTPREGLLALVANSFATNLLDKEMRAREFEFLGRMLGRVPIRRLVPREDPTRSGELCEVIFRSYEAIKS
ncbi:MAG: hypothetical protein ABSB66_16365 [Candidatus Acidiferrales bacterium]